MKVLVTGATGRLGTATLAALLAKGFSVRSVVRDEKAPLPGGVDKFVFNLGLGPLPAGAFDGVHYVIHLAGLVGWHSYKELLLHNAFATKNLLANCPSSIRKVVLASSISVYGNYPGQLVDESFMPKPATDYGKSKLMAEEFARAYCPQLPIIFLRFGMIYGPGFEEGYFQVLKYLQQGKIRVIGSGKNRLPLVHVDDAVRAILLAIEKPTSPCSAYNIVSDEKPTQEELLFLAAQALGVPPPFSGILAPVAIAMATAKLVISKTRLCSPPGIMPEYIGQISSDRTFSTDKARQELGFEARVKIKEGLKQVVGIYLQKGEGI